MRTYTVDVYDSRWLDSPHSPCLIKIQINIISNALKITFIERLSMSYDLGSVKLIIMKFI